MRFQKLTFLFLFFTATLFAQSYQSNQSIGTTAPFDYTTTGTTVLSVPSSNVLSAWQTLPFAFNFYGQAVTGYYVSDNGYITFDQNATTSVAANTAIPNVGGPNNAIYAFWDDLNVVSGAGSPDNVRAYTYGVAPYRVHVIQYFSVTPASGSGFVYAAIRIYECGDFDIVLNYGNATGMTATVGAENNDGTVGVQLGNSPNFSYPAVGAAGADDIVYTFSWDQIQYDMAITSLDLENNVVIGNQSITGTVSNNGSVAINSFDLHYTVDGGATQTMNVSGVNIPAFSGTYNFTHSAVWNVATGGVNHNLCVWTDNYNNGNPDERTCNDQVCEDLYSFLGISGTKKILIEEFTGAWCGWCPDGEVVVDGILATYPDDVISVSVHDNDGMAFNDGIRTAFSVSAYPNGMVDRKVFPGESDEPHSRGQWLANTLLQRGAYTPADLNITTSFDPGTRVLDITFTANFVDYASGDIRFVPMIVEDSVVGSGSQYNQVNYLNATVGHHYYLAGDPIVGYVHKRVLRALPGGAFGNAGIIPAQVSQGASYTENFQYTIPASYDESKITVVGALAFYSTTVGQREVINAKKAELVSVNTNKVAQSVGQIKVFPNPTSTQFNIDFNVTEAVNAEIVLFDVYGRRVEVVKNTNFAEGQHNVSHNISHLASGNYFVSIITDKGQTFLS